MDHPQTPRIIAPHLSSFQHRIVRILGKVVQLRGETAVIDAGGQIDVVLTRVRIRTFLRSWEWKRKREDETREKERREGC